MLLLLRFIRRGVGAADIGDVDVRLLALLGTNSDSWARTPIHPCSSSPCPGEPDSGSCKVNLLISREFSPHLRPRNDVVDNEMLDARAATSREESMPRVKRHRRRGLRRLY